MTMIALSTTSVFRKQEVAPGARQNLANIRLALAESWNQEISQQSAAKIMQVIDKCSFAAVGKDVLSREGRKPAADNSPWGVRP